MRQQALIILATLSLLFVSGCEPKDGHVYFRNNSDQTLTLHQAVRDYKDSSKVTYRSPATAAPRTTAEGVVGGSEGFCMLYWEIVDQAGQLVRSIPGEICDGDTVTYP